MARIGGVGQAPKKANKGRGNTDPCPPPKLPGIAGHTVSILINSLLKETGLLTKTALKLAPLRYFISPTVGSRTRQPEEDWHSSLKAKGCTDEKKKSGKEVPKLY